MLKELNKLPNEFICAQIYYCLAQGLKQVEIDLICYKHSLYT